MATNIAYRYSPASSSSSTSSQTRRKSNCRRKTSFRKRCLTMAKQQKTRVYILRRCVCMLLCWHAHSVSDD
ncbi:small polypeptide DEVIL 10-like [Macadamia integrifolia]|uniref:small polypeptide DEVIL 10-like n=1 Tax=Macadamia integrifolia TaxID=60698 RepID=UPI001C500892|nr:small polypeptide DEVIL 10-like [Macadamia integrifolia]